MKIVVTHATGTIGRRVLLELLAPKFSVRAIARDPARLPKEIRTQVEVVRGASVDYARGLVAMFTELAEGIARAEPRTVDSTTPTTLATWAQSGLLPEHHQAGLRSQQTKYVPILFSRSSCY
jgi:NAD(P)-dependent dehydrogenase (short-subunit alcohol dehydrogenase family)